MSLQSDVTALQVLWLPAGETELYLLRPETQYRLATSATHVSTLQELWT